MKLAGEIDPETGRPTRDQWRALYDRNREELVKRHGEDFTPYFARRYLWSYASALERFHDLDSVPHHSYAGAAMDYFMLDGIDLPTELVSEIQEAMHDAAREALVYLMREYASKIAPVAEALRGLRL